MNSNEKALEWINERIKDAQSWDLDTVEVYETIKACLEHTLVTVRAKPEITANGGIQVIENAVKCTCARKGIYEDKEMDVLCVS